MTKSIAEPVADRGEAAPRGQIRGKAPSDPLAAGLCVDKR